MAKTEPRTTTPPAPPPPTVGRVVHYRIGGTDEEPELRPAIVVRVWSGDCCNLQVFLDGRNDDDAQVGVTQHEAIRGMSWRTSVTEGAGVGEWRWPARS